MLHDAMLTQGLAEPPPFHCRMYQFCMPSSGKSFSDPRSMRTCHEKDFEKKSWFSEGVRVLKLRVFQSSSHCV
eukprot:5112155-Amphidinium_carterae.1